MRFHIGLSINAKRLLKFLLPLLVGLLAYFGLCNIQVLAATNINLEPSSVELCNNSTGSCSTNLLDKYVGSSSIRYSSISGYGAISTFKVNYDSPEFSYYCYESEYNFHATYELDFAIAYRGVNPVEYGKFASIKVYANNVEIPVITSYSSSSNYYHIKFDYPGYNNNIRIELVQDDSILYAYPLALYTLRNNSITCIDQTTLSSVNQSINNSTNTIINNNNQNTQSIINNNNQSTQSIINNNNQNTQEIKDTLLDDTNSSIDKTFFEGMEWSSGSLTSLLLFPIDLLNTIVNNVDSCHSVDFDLSSITTKWGGDNYVLRLPCIRLKMRQFLGNWYDVFDLMIAGILFYYFASNLILKIHGILSGVDSMPYFYSSSSKGRTSNVGTYDKSTGEVIT